MPRDAAVLAEAAVCAASAVAAACMLAVVAEASAQAPSAAVLASLAGPGLHVLPSLRRGPRASAALPLAHVMRAAPATGTAATGAAAIGTAGGGGPAGSVAPRRPRPPLSARGPPAL